MKKLFSVSVAGVLLFSMSMVVNAVEPEDAIEYRQAVMKTIVWNMKPMGTMVKGKMPFDAQAFAKRAENLAFLSKLPLEGFVSGSYKGDTDAKPTISDNWHNFKAKMANFEKEATELAKVAKTATALKEVRSQFGDTAKTCKACHKRYKSK